MNKFTEKMFGVRKAIVNFIDLDDDSKIITSSGELSGRKGEEITFDVTDQIDKLIDKGYVLAQNNFIENGQKPIFGENTEPFIVSFHHGHQVVDIDHPDFGYEGERLQKKIKQIIHYEGAANRTPEDNVTEVVFNHAMEFDKVTGTVIKNDGWIPKKQNFLMIGTPTIPGFIPDRAVVGGESIIPNSANKKYIVNYTINTETSTQEQGAKIIFVDIASDNKLITTVYLTGKPNMPIEYNPDEKIKELMQNGYVLVNNGFNAEGKVEFYGNSTSYVPTFVISMKHTDKTVSDSDPAKTAADSPVTRLVRFIVKFEGAGKATPKSVEQIVKWHRIATPDHAVNDADEGNYSNTEWQLDRKSFDEVKVPVIAGYHTNLKLVTPKEVDEDTEIEVVTYIPNGHIVPIDENGVEIPGAPRPQFETDPNDPTKIATNEIVPSVAGYTAKVVAVNPRNPNKNLQVTYREKEEEKDDSILYVNVGTESTNSTQENDTAETSMSESELKIDSTVDDSESNVETSSQLQQAQQNATTQEPTEGYLPITRQATAQYPGAKAQVAIVNFIDLDHNGVQLTSSGPLTGNPGDSINDLYSTEIPLKALNNIGYKVIFNNFDTDGFIQRFDNNDLMPQIFTIALSKKENDK